MLPAPSAVRVLLDTNTAISGLLWDSMPRRLLEAARHRRTELFTSAMLLAELSDVLPRPKFAAKIAVAGLSADELVRRYAQLIRVGSAAGILPVVARDPDDDALIPCAVAAQDDWIAE
jgi:putative PIN family toxin of toxin-antitoxin system